MSDQSAAVTRNELSGESGNTVQAGTVYGGVHFGGEEQPFPVLRQLPRDVSAFVDRRSCIARLDALLPDVSLPSSARDVVPVSAIAGPPGVGKTALALHWAHSVRDRYPDGDLYANLQGFGSGLKLDADHVLDGFLRALRVSPERIPADREGRSAMFRSMLDGKRVLILIDDAATVSQVRPLLPASPTCLVIVTSRNSLSGLVARDGAVRMVLDALPPDESIALLREIVGSGRVDAEPIAAAQLAERCAYLPLALRIIAERINARPFADLAGLVGQIADEKARLDALGLEDDELSDVRAVFSSSYQALPPAAARLFRLLGLHPGAEMSTPAVAAVADLDTSEVRHLLSVLTNANLLQATAADRFRLHDLLRVYAAECAERDEPLEARAAALHRVLSWYLVTVEAGHRVILPSFHRVPLDTADSDVQSLSFGSVDRAMNWFEKERINLLEALRSALQTKNYGVAWRLPAVMYGFFELRQYWTEWREIHRLGLRAAQAAEDRFGEACNYLGLGDANWLLGDLQEALDCYGRAAALGRAERDGWIEGFSRRQIGTVLYQQGRVDEAVAAVRESIEVFRAYGERRGEGMALLSLASCHSALDRFGQEVEDCRAALDIFQQLGDAWSVAWGQCALARAWSDMGDHQKSLHIYQEALEAFREFGDKRNQLRAMVGISEALDAMGESEATAHWHRAALLADRLDEPQTAEMRGKIARALGAAGREGDSQ